MGKLLVECWLMPNTPTYTLSPVRMLSRFLSRYTFTGPLWTSASCRSLCRPCRQLLYCPNPMRAVPEGLMFWGDGIPGSVVASWLMSTSGRPPGAMRMTMRRSFHKLIVSGFRVPLALAPSTYTILQALGLRAIQ